MKQQSPLNKFEASVKAEVDKMGAVVVAALILRLEMMEDWRKNTEFVKQVKAVFHRPNNLVFPMLWDVSQIYNNPPPVHKDITIQALLCR